MSYRIRIWSPFHLETQSIPILNLNSPKNEKRILRSCNFSPDHISYIITVIISLFKVKYNQISAEPSNYNSQQKGLHHIFVCSAGQHRLGLDRWSASTVQASPRKPGLKIMSAHVFYAFLWDLKFGIGFV